VTIDYKSTVYLPKTEFAMRGKLPEREPEMLERWAKMNMFQRLRDDARGREKFILHDGPPYANGHLHIGHALNKILKDVINRSQQMLGRDANYVPGWDCHGLPIEWKIEEKYRADGKDKDDVPTIEFRAECREFAAHWIDIQREEFKRLGVEGNWDNPYTTMTYAAEAQIVAELGKFLLNGGLFKGAKPVMWSVVEKTALAEAEVEYKDHKSTTIWVRFPVVTTPLESLNGASVLIWTTTPWTIPGNRAVAYGPEMDYVVIEVTGVTDDSLAQTGEKLALAEALTGKVTEDVGITDYKILHNFKGADLSGAVCRHPFHGQGYDFDVPLLPGDHVTAEDGTGFVHTAPGHGAEDFVVGQAHGIEAPQTVGPDGLFYDHVALFAGDHVYKVNGKVADTLQEAGALLKRGTITHSYPHSWRSKAPLIFRNTPQWFISMDTNDLRQKALDAIDKTAFYPEAGRNRLRAMIQTRPDWCVSRQRAWGVPITVFVSKETGEPLRDAGVMERIVAAINEEGADAWFASDPQRFLGDDFKADDFEQVTDILDVWFDSGSTHAFVLEARDDLQSPASLYLEGSDQHRGWFHSSLLESCGTRGRAPYDGVLTHGFVLAEDKLKMSKSSGNTVAPQDVIKSHGADILRLWVVASDYSEDLKIGPEIIKHQADAYRRLRNTMRFLLGNLDGFAEDERVAPSDMPELDRWVLHRLHELDALVRNAANTYDFHAMFTALHNFCAVDLSAFYFDVRKDILYCSRRDDPVRRATRTVLDELFSCLTAWLAPILCFTAEEAWLSRNPGDDESVHLRQFPDVPADWRDDALAEKWETIRAFRRAVTGALEIERAAKHIGSSLQAAPVIYAGDKYRIAMDGLDMAEICITSEASFGEGDAPQDAHHADDGSGISVMPALAEGEKCERCWRFMPDVGALPSHPTVCGRCADAVDHFPIAAE
jgi:isoleucyl-tRNA synthetase